MSRNRRCPVAESLGRFTREISFMFDMCARRRRQGYCLLCRSSTYNFLLGS